MKKKIFLFRPHLRSSLRHNTTRTSKSPGRKTVSFFSINSDKKVSNVNDCLQIMQNGTEMIKIRTHVRQFKRFFSLDTDCAYIRWQPSNKKPHKARCKFNNFFTFKIIYIHHSFISCFSVFFKTILSKQKIIENILFVNYMLYS